MNPTLLDFAIRFAEADLDRVFVVSDLHFSHANIIKYCHRPFADPAEMDRAMLARWNATVPADATVWVIGDVTIKPEKLHGVLAQLRGRKILVSGNHDQPHPVSLHNKGRRPDDLSKFARAYREAGFDAVHLAGEFDLPNFGKVYVCHYPYTTQPDRLKVRIPDDGETPLIHGHVHDKWRFRGRMLNVSVEVQDYRPISLREVRDLFRAERAAGWPTATNEPDDEKIPESPADLPPDERTNGHQWFLVSPGAEPLPDLPGIGMRTVERPDSASDPAGRPVENPPTLLEVRIDGANPDGEQLRRRLYLHPRLTPAARQLLPGSESDRRPE